MKFRERVRTLTDNTTEVFWNRIHSCSSASAPEVKHSKRSCAMYRLRR